MEEPKENNNTNKILYIGADDLFLENTQFHLKRLYSALDTNFETLYSDDEKIVQSYVLKIQEMRPKLIIIDFSKNQKGMLHLARLWERTNTFQNIPIIGIVDYKQGRGMVVKTVMTKIKCIHVKSLEYESLIYNMVILGFPKIVESHGFALAKLEDAIHCYQICKVGLVNENFIKIESDYQMTPKQVLKLNNHWERKKIIQSKLVMCVNQGQKNTYYNYKYGQVLQFALADPVEMTDDLTPEEYELKQNERQELVEDVRYKMKKWIHENSFSSYPKFLKCYVIDKDGHFLDIKPLTDMYNFVIRNQPYMENTKKELINISPQVIIYNMEYIDKDTLEANADIAYTYNDSRMLQHLIKTIKEVAHDSPPLIVIFNSGQYDTNYMQKVFNYPNLIAVNDEMTYEHAMKLLNMLEPKISALMPQPNKGDVYIHKNSELSYGEIEMDISIAACSENDIYFNSKETFNPGTVLRVSLPVPMYITVLPIPEFSKAVGYYYGIIHGIGEEERKLLRRFINSVFFRGIDNEKQTDAEAMAKKKQSYIDQKNAKDEERKKLIESAKMEQKLKDQRSTS